jgi:cytidyltransferase-like protein
MSKKKAIIVSGYFNRIHKGHLEYFNNAKALADELFVIVNNYHQRALKGSKEFQKEETRATIRSQKDQFASKSMLLLQMGLEIKFNLVASY